MGCDTIVQYPQFYCYSKMMLGIIQHRLGFYMKREMPDVQAGLRKAGEQEPY